MKQIRTPLLLSLVLISILLAGCGTVPSSSWPGLSVKDNLAFVADGPSVYAVDVNSGKLAWKYPEKANPNKFYYTEPAIQNGLILVGDSGNTVQGFKVADFRNLVVALNAQDGSEKWTSNNSTNRIVGAALVLDDKIYVPSTDYFLYALKSDGSLIWSFKTGEAIWAKPVSDGKNVFVASTDHNLYALNADNGSKIWQTDLGAPTFNSLAISEDKSTLFVATGAKKIFAINAADGKTVWSKDTTGNVWSPVIQKEDVIYFGDESGKVTALSTKDGSQQWQSDAGSAVIGSGAFTDKTVVFPTENKLVQAFNFDGSKAWNAAVSGKLYSNLINTGNRLLVPVTAGDNKLLLVSLNPTDGSQNWAFTTP
jgi:eukaryotic-like serine/threonine-protein kinase